MTSRELKREWKRSGSSMSLKAWARKKRSGEFDAWKRRKAGR